MEQKHIFIDVDGTLLDHDTGVPESSVHAIRQARKNGHRVFICTGRAKSEMNETVTAIGFDGFVYSSGAALEIGHRRIHAEAMAPQALQALIGHMDAQGICYILEGQECSFINPKASEMFTELAKTSSEGFRKEIINMFMQNDRVRSTNAYDGEVHPISKLSLFAEQHQLNGLEARLHSGFYMIRNQSSPTGLSNCEIAMVGITKASGIARILQHLDAPVESTICYGDSLNDLEMLQYCKIGIAMGNGIDAVKRIADDVTDSILQDGIYNSFRKYGLI